MNITIRRLTPDLAEDYVHFFDVTPHDDNKDEHKCYCVCWCGDDSEGKDFSSREKRRACAMEYVRDGSIQGYLAFYDGRIVGWCNANTKSKCLKCVSWRRQMGPVEKITSDPDAKVKSIFCFVIAPEMKRMGIATQLLERVCEDAAAEGFDYAEAYANKKYSAHDFRGPMAMYEKCGFSKYAKAKRLLVMRKALK